MVKSTGVGQIEAGRREVPCDTREEGEVRFASGKKNMNGEEGKPRDENGK